MTYSAPGTMSEMPLRHMMQVWADYMGAGNGAATGQGATGLAATGRGEAEPCRTLT